MNICYLLETTDLWGGVRVVFDQARGLTSLGHSVLIRALTGDHSWYPYGLPIEYISRFDAPFQQSPVAVICTYWSTVAPGAAIGAPLTVHLCQGYEGDFYQLQKDHPAIENAYRTQIPKLTNGAWISRRLHEVFGTELFPVHQVGQIIDTDLFRPASSSYLQTVASFFTKKHLPRVLIVGDYRFTVKGVADALKAVAILRKGGESIHLIRVSTTDIFEDEQDITGIDESHVKVPSWKMADIYHKTDFFIAPSHSQEGFGLPFAEALSSGIPSVATRIPSYLDFDKELDYACFVEEKEPEAMAEALRNLIHSPKLIKKLRKRGPEVIKRRFDKHSVARKIESILKKYLQQTN